MTTPTDGEWVSAKEALEFLTSLRMNYHDAVSAICTRAHARLVAARAKTFISDGKRHSEVDVPPGFWWAEGLEGLTQDWATGYFETWIKRGDTRLQAFDVTFRRKDIEQFLPTSAESAAPRRGQRRSGRTVFIGHGHSKAWHELYVYLSGVHGLSVKEFNSGSSPVGISVTDHLQSMLDEAGFAFLILTGDDAHASGDLYPRLNVVHEAGLFQGKLGFLDETGNEDLSDPTNRTFGRGGCGARIETVPRRRIRAGAAPQTIRSPASTPFWRGRFGGLQPCATTGRNYAPASTRLQLSSPAASP